MAVKDSSLLFFFLCASASKFIVCSKYLLNRLREGQDCSSLEPPARSGFEDARVDPSRGGGGVQGMLAGLSGPPAVGTSCGLGSWPSLHLLGDVCVMGRERGSVSGVGFCSAAGEQSTEQHGRGGAGLIWGGQSWRKHFLREEGW